MRYRFLGAFGCYKDLAGEIPCANGDRVAHWKNWGVVAGFEAAAIQSVEARRPIFRTGGLNGYPCIECDRFEQQHFEDIQFVAQGGTINSIATYMVSSVTDQVGELASAPSLFGSTASGGGKNRVHFRDTAGSQYVQSKTGFAGGGNVAAPQVIVARTTAITAYRQKWNGGLHTSGSATGFTGTAITQTQFLRNTGIAGGGYFHGRLYEVLVHAPGSSIANASLDDIEAWLAAMYAIDLG